MIINFIYSLTSQILDFLSLIEGCIVPLEGDGLPIVIACQNPAPINVQQFNSENIDLRPIISNDFNIHLTEAHNRIDGLMSVILMPVMPLRFVDSCFSMLFGSLPVFRQNLPLLDVDLMHKIFKKHILSIRNGNGSVEELVNHPHFSFYSRFRAGINAITSFSSYMFITPGNNFPVSVDEKKLFVAFMEVFNCYHDLCGKKVRRQFFESLVLEQDEQVFDMILKNFFSDENKVRQFFATAVKLIPNNHVYRSDLISQKDTFLIEKCRDIEEIIFKCKDSVV